jgi:hypothetical protein
MFMENSKSAAFTFGNGGMATRKRSARSAAKVARRNGTRAYRSGSWTTVQSGTAITADFLEG